MNKTEGISAADLYSRFPALKNGDPVQQVRFEVAMVRDKVTEQIGNVLMFTAPPIDRRGEIDDDPDRNHEPYVLADLGSNPSLTIGVGRREIFPREIHAMSALLKNELEGEIGTIYENRRRSVNPIQLRMDIRDII